MGQRVGPKGILPFAEDILQENERSLNPAKAFTNTRQGDDFH